MKTKILIATAVIALIGSAFLLNTAFKEKEGCPVCPLVTLDSYPAVLKVKPSGFQCADCSDPTQCSCENGNFVVSDGAQCPPYTYHFTNTTTGWTCNITSSAQPFQCGALKGSAGNSYSLYVTDYGGSPSPTYTFTTTSCTSGESPGGN